VCGKSADSPFEAVVGRLAAARSLLLVTHARPDGDGLGSMVALALAAEDAGRAVRLLVPDSLPRRYAFLLGGREVAREDAFAPLADAADCVAVLDTCAFSQLDALREAIAPRRGKVVVVDHHATADDVGAVQWLDTSAAATGVMVADLLEALGWPVGLPAAEALTTAVTTDTGWLRFANTDARCLRYMARWLEAGVRPDVLYRQIYQADRPQRLALTARMLQTLELHAGSRLAAMTIRKADFHATGALPEETENLVNEALRIASVETAILLVENDDAVRVSLRSRDAVNVAEIAARFGGGGHARAAGLRAQTDLDALKAQLVEACVEALGQSAGGG
jgi:phosphoesterase RecJ-like protein